MTHRIEFLHKSLQMLICVSGPWSSAKLYASPFSRIRSCVLFPARYSLVLGHFAFSPLSSVFCVFLVQLTDRTLLFSSVSYQPSCLCLFFTLKIGPSMESWTKRGDGWWNMTRLCMTRIPWTTSCAASSTSLYLCSLSLFPLTFINVLLIHTCAFAFLRARNSASKSGNLMPAGTAFLRSCDKEGLQIREIKFINI
jgi:hypothetical protein